MLARIRWRNVAIAGLLAGAAIWPLLSHDPQPVLPSSRAIPVALPARVAVIAPLRTTTTSKSASHTKSKKARAPAHAKPKSTKSAGGARASERISATEPEAEEPRSDAPDASRQTTAPAPEAVKPQPSPTRPEFGLP